MNIFQEINERITAKEVATAYGLKVSNNNMACCPFHDDRHPSMKIDDRYYCFACGSKGDAIGYVAQLNGISQYDAARKIIHDFHMPVNIKNSNYNYNQDFRYQKKKQEQAKLRRTKERFSAWRWKEISKLQNINSQINLIKEFYKDKPKEVVLSSDEFARALSAETTISYWLDILCTGTEDEQQEYFIKQRKGADAYDEQIRQYTTSLMAGDRSNTGYRDQ